MTVDIAKLRALCDAATPGPWESGDRWLAFPADADSEGDERVFCNFFDGQEPAASDLAFIAAARTALPALLDEIERLRTTLAHTREPLLAKALLEERKEMERLRAEVESLTSNAKALRKLVVEPIEKTSKLQKAIADAIGFESDDLGALARAARLLRAERDALEAKLAAMTAARDELYALSHVPERNQEGEWHAAVERAFAVGKNPP